MGGIGLEGGCERVVTADWEEMIRDVESCTYAFPAHHRRKWFVVARVFGRVLMMRKGWIGCCCSLIHLFGNADKWWWFSRKLSRLIWLATSWSACVFSSSLHVRVGKPWKTIVGDDFHKLNSLSICFTFRQLISSWKLIWMSFLTGGNNVYFIVQFFVIKRVLSSSKIPFFTEEIALVNPIQEMNRNDILQDHDQALSLCYLFHSPI